MNIPPIRIGTRGVIVENDRVLLVKFDDETGPHYNYPGGGLQLGETAIDAVIREIHEETSARAEVIRLLCVYEYLAPIQPGVPPELQKMELVFLCRLTDDANPRLPDMPDPNQVAVEWISLNDLEKYLIYPPIAGMVKERLKVSAGIDPYLGNCYDFPLFT